MYRNFSQKLEMRIPQENAYTGMKIMAKQTGNLTEFLNSNFKFPSKNLNEIKEFIKKDKEMEKIIYDMPRIISNEFNYNLLSLDFMKETDPNI